MRFPPALPRNLLLILLCGLLAAATPPLQRGNRQGRNGRMQSGEAAAESARVRERETAQRKQQQQALQKRLSTMKQHAAKARQRALAYQQSQKKSSGSILLQTFQQRCASCHTYPDPRSETDQAWLRRVSVTQCKGTPAQAREQLSSYLASLEGLHPRTITSAAEPTPTQVALTTTLETGEVFLRNKSGAVFRLRWDEGTEGETRIVPAGTYTLLGYRVVAGPWTIAATGGERSTLLAPGAPRHLPINTAIKAQLDVEPRGENALVRLNLIGSDGMGVGLYGGGYSIPITYVILQGSGVVGQGTFRTLGAGTYTALVTPPAGPTARVRVELPRSLPVRLQGTGIATLPKVRPRVTPSAVPGPAARPGRREL